MSDIERSGSGARYTNWRQGRAVRARLRALLDLRPGAMLPKEAELGAALGIHHTQAARHKRRVLIEAGVATTKIGRRIYVGGPRP